MIISSSLMVSAVGWELFLKISIPVPILGTIKVILAPIAYSLEMRPGNGRIQLLDLPTPSNTLYSTSSPQTLLQ